ncbi:MAG: TRAP transporter large permease subunit, partial [Hyphomicrobiaceae bacterium]
MPLNEIMSIVLLVVVCAAMMMGFPVAFTLGGVSVLFALVGNAMGVFDLIFLHAVPGRIFGVMTNEVLVAVPLFVFMGVMLERSRIAEDLL